MLLTTAALKFLLLGTALCWTLSLLAGALERDERRRRRQARLRIIRAKKAEVDLVDPQALKDFVVRSPTRVITTGPVLLLQPETVDAMVIRHLRESRAILLAHNGKVN